MAPPNNIIITNASTVATVILIRVTSSRGVEQRFAVHRDFLRHYTGFFDADVAAASGVGYIPYGTLYARSFSIFVQWLYTQRVEWPGRGDDEYGGRGWVGSGVTGGRAVEAAARTRRRRSRHGTRGWGGGAGAGAGAGGGSPGIRHLPPLRYLVGLYVIAAKCRVPRLQNECIRVMFRQFQDGRATLPNTVLQELFAYDGTEQEQQQRAESPSDDDDNTDTAEMTDIDTLDSSTSSSSTDDPDPVSGAASHPHSRLYAFLGDMFIERPAQFGAPEGFPPALVRLISRTLAWKAARRLDSIFQERICQAYMDRDVEGLDGETRTKSKAKGKGTTEAAPENARERLAEIACIVDL